ncbi:hypothetical protein A2J02_14825 [Rhodococcus sp. EPR-147]|nr:hypothetical protein A2J02_14825 [Rhodococcus sp. EPR-147]
MVLLAEPGCSAGIPTAESQAPTRASIAISGNAVRVTRFRRSGAALFFTRSLPVDLPDRNRADLLSYPVHRLR